MPFCMEVEIKSVTVTVTVTHLKINAAKLRVSEVFENGFA